MSTTTIEDPMKHARRRIDRLQEFAQIVAAADSSRIRRHLDALHREEASVLAAAGTAPDEVEEKLGQLRTRLAVAENSLFADVSDEWSTFAAAVEDELRSWDIYLERLQATAAARTGNARERAEAAIADVRTQRIAVYDRLAQARADVNGAWHEQRNHVCAARDELERKADELPAKIMKLRFEKEESDGQTIDPALVSALVALCVGARVVHAGVAKRRLAWRRRPNRERRRRP